ncbi:WHG domain-containing protein [Paenibacillus filicis]|uniref:WHG domain-containing protein n=1 Tax=Paenibacillus gyeongsangnamensis TaxID=3388067 RepID=A0ABT4Q8H2_9BACL|nr:TetR/AcrR family transcriptional regulator [Paenibacillus filicis]MCZ8513167.1 WHG domain-containing protein [Paenibacillus filicis]
MPPRPGISLTTILEAATEIADTNGIDEVTLTSLAQKLNIRSPSLYNHVNGLQGLRKLLAIYGLEQLLIVLTRSAIGRSGDNAIHEMGKAYVSFARSHPGLYEVTQVALEPSDPEIQRLGQEIVDLVLQVLSAYDLEEETAFHIARGLRSIMHGFASLEQKGGFGSQPDTNVSLELLINTFLAGLRTLKNQPLS